jgi:predicted nucleotidyltransferase
MSSNGARLKPWAVTPEKIAEAVRRLVAAAAPTRLIAFGSAATGDLSMANDLDLLVVEAQVADRYQEMLRLRRVLRGLLMPIDLIVTSQALYDSRAQVPGTVEFAARTQGRVLYAGD